MAVLWRGDYETGNTRQWHIPDGTPSYHLIPNYGRPARRADQGDLAHSGIVPSYYGDGTLLGLVTNDPDLVIPDIVELGPVRQGKYSIKITVKSEAGGGVEPDDCAINQTDCTTRRTEQSMHQVLQDQYDAMPYMGENWISFSFYIPSNWDSTTSTDFGPHFFSIKAKSESGSSGAFAIALKSYGWELQIINDYTQTQPIRAATSHYYYYRYSNTRPADNDYDRNYRSDFPDVSVSQTALASINKGGWTDWIMNVKWDESGPVAGGTGVMKLWKREDSGSWIQIINIIPKTVNRDGTDYDRGIGYNVPAAGSNKGGYGIQAGMYMAKSQVWPLAANRVMYNDNIRVHDGNTTFNEMRPEGVDPPVPLARRSGMRSSGIRWR